MLAGRTVWKCGSVKQELNGVRKAAFAGASALMSLALAVATFLWVLNGAPSAEAQRTLRRQSSSNQDGGQEHGPTNRVSGPYTCGYFYSSDPQDVGIAHQPCYGLDGSIRFCCLSGSSHCSCPIATGSELGCYNYEAGSTLNANTGDECGYFLPEGTEISSRRQLVGCTCPGQDDENRCFPNLQLQSQSKQTGSAITCDYTGTLPFPYGFTEEVCVYDASTGVFKPDESIDYSYCCPLGLTGCS